MTGPLMNAATSITGLSVSSSSGGGSSSSNDSFQMVAK